MRVTVEELIKELSVINPKLPVLFRVGDPESALRNSVQRIDNMGNHVVVVVEKGV